MSEREPEHNESTDEEAWLDLVDRLEHMDASEPVRPSPAQPGGTPDSGGDAGGDTGADTGATDTGTPQPGGTGAGQAPPSPAERTRDIFANQPLAAAGPRDYAAEDDDDDGSFIPPDPPPLGIGEPLVVLGWLGTLAGPLLLLLFAMFWRDAPLAVILGTVAVFAGSAGYLLFRLPQHRDDGDDGAAV